MEISLILSIISILGSVVNSLTLCHFKNVKSPCLDIEFFRSKSMKEARKSLDLPIK